MELEKFIRKEGKYLIFKHSIYCPTSLSAYKQVEEYKKEKGSLDVILLIVQENLELKLEVAKHFNVEHQSPQIIFIDNGVVKKTLSHFDITKENLKKLV